MILFPEKDGELIRQRVIVVLCSWENETENLFATDTNTYQFLEDLESIEFPTTINSIHFETKEEFINCLYFCFPVEKKKSYTSFLLTLPKLVLCNS